MENKIIWPGWETVGLIGRGSFGAVYKIQRNVFGNVEEAALKVISIPQNPAEIDSLYDDGYDDESIRSTFQSHLKSIIAEYALMRKLNGCANIVNCDDVRYVQHDDEIGWDIFIKMELLKPLARSLPGQITEETVIKIAEDMCKALIVCKENGVVHRDIKPQNIFLSSHGDYKLGDFGIAKTVEQTMGGTKIGTYNYMAPEVYNNQPYGTTADIYSLGLVLYWLLNERRLPFLPLPPEKLDADMERRSRERRFSGEPLPPPLYGNEKLKAIVLKTCAFDAKNRYASAQELLDDLQPKPSPKPNPKSTPVNLDVHKEVTFKYKDYPAGKDFTIRLDYNDVRYRVPLDVKDGQIIYLPGEGKYDRDTGCKGDLYITINILPKTWGWQPVLKVLLAIAAICIAVLFGYKLFDGKKQVEVPEETAHIHSWKAATCTTPKTCKLCGVISGSSLGHDFKAATCKEPQTCTVCNKIVGKKLDHQWKEATIYAPKTCKICGTMEGEPLNESSSYHVGEIVLFGNYEQDNKSGGEEPIEWQVLDVQGNKMLLLSKYALDSQRYFTETAPVSWRQSSLRAWLNNEFLYAAFSESEQKSILMTDVDNIATQNNAGWQVADGETTKDRIFILSCAEAERYFGDESSRICRATAYAVSQGARGKWDSPDGTVNWWLRSLDSSKYQAYFVNFEGKQHKDFVYMVGNDFMAVRPAMWVEFN